MSPRNSSVSVTDSDSGSRKAVLTGTSDDGIMRPRMEDPSLTFKGDPDRSLPNSAAVIVKRIGKINPKLTALNEVLDEYFGLESEILKAVQILKRGKAGTTRPSSSAGATNSTYEESLLHKSSRSDLKK